VKAIALIEPTGEGIRRQRDRRKKFLRGWS